MLLTGSLIGAVFGVICFFVVEWFGWQIEVNMLLLFVCSFLPSFVTGIIFGCFKDSSFGLLLRGTLKAALCTMGLGLVASTAVSIYASMITSSPGEWLIMALLLGVMFGGTAPVLLIIVGD